MTPAPDFIPVQFFAFLAMGTTIYPMMTFKPPRNP